MNPQSVPDVMDAEDLPRFSQVSEDKAEFTPSERDEIISRLQAVENIAHINMQFLTDLTNELFPVNADDETLRVNMVKEIHGFAKKLGDSLDKVFANPMFRAMMPPGLVDEVDQG